MTWWEWSLLGILLLNAEIFSVGGFYLVFFGAGAFLVSLLVANNISGPPPLQWILFSGISIALLLLFRARLISRLSKSQKHNPDSLLGGVVVSMETIEQGKAGRIEFRGSSWQGRNVGSETIKSGEKGKVVGRQGLVLDIEKSS